jgi:YHS domain-containing protein
MNNENNKECPVCGMDTKPEINATYQGKTYNFCCSACKQEFEQNPRQYVKGTAHAVSTQ